ncbi:MAG: acetolactate synthase [Actinomycetia bacterium]|nr:acetolactate synthase [Actinomycetes bacterium]MCH9801333.1 acetolactate synthase [Actinomycetes bacterium]
MAEQRDSAVPSEISGHGGSHAVSAAVAAGQQVMWTLSGAHVFPLYDAAVGGRDQILTGGAGPMRLLDVRNEATAAFAAEATGKLTRTPGLAVVTAGPGVTNTVSAITGAWFNGSPMVVVGGRAPGNRWGSGALQELDHPPILDTVTKRAATIVEPTLIGQAVTEAFQLANSPHRGPVFLDIPMDALFTESTASVTTIDSPRQATDDEQASRIAALLASAARPVLILGSDVWMGRADNTARDFATELDLPVIANGMGRGILPPDHPGLVTRARSTALAEADLVVVVGAPLDFRLGFGSFGGRAGNPPAEVVHIVDAPSQIAQHVDLVASAAGPIEPTLASIRSHFSGQIEARHPWRTRLREQHLAAIAADAALLASDADPIHPARIYGELIPRLTDDTIVIGDGGDFVSFAGRFLQPAQPGNWLDPGPYGCLGTGLGYAMAARVTRPNSPVILLMGDGAAGFSLPDVDTLVRHNLPVVMVVGNNSAWGLEKHPMQFLYGYDVAADLQPTRYDDVVKALGGAGETVSDPRQIGPALDRALAANVPYLVNVLTDPGVAYPRSTTGV